MEVTDVQRTHYVDWPAVFAGAVVAAAISFVLLTAGTGIGLSLVSAESYHSYPKSAAWLAAFWAIAVPIGSFLAGGYVAGRMRPAWAGSATEEGQFRDGAHGLLVWGVSILLGAFLAFATAAATARATAAGVGHLTDRATIMAPSIDTLLRAPSNAAQAPPPVTEAQRAEIGRIFAASLGPRSLSDDDRKYLASVVGQRAGIPPAEAEQRVTDAYNAAVKAVETARRATVAASLVTATALLMGLAAAWYGAQRGGHHRDTNRPARFSAW
jgi:hypothetical protein